MGSSAVVRLSRRGGAAPRNSGTAGWMGLHSASCTPYCAVLGAMYTSYRALGSDTAGCRYFGTWTAHLPECFAGSCTPALQRCTAESSYPFRSTAYGARLGGEANLPFSSYRVFSCSASQLVLLSASNYNDQNDNLALLQSTSLRPFVSPRSSVSRVSNETTRTKPLA